MERLTKHWGNNPPVPTGYNQDFILDMEPEQLKGYNALLQRLSDYEDIGLEPQEIREAHRRLCGELLKAGGVDTIYGYRVKHLVLIADLLKKRLISEENLAELFDNFELMYNIIIQQHQFEIKAVMNSMVAESLYPSLENAVSRLFLEKSAREVYRFEDWKQHSGLLEEDAP